MNEQRCPGCHHPTPLHTMDCDYRNPLYPILTDLIAELRQASGDDRWIHLPDGHYCTPVLPLTVAADRAEARLREVSGDE